MARWSNTRLLTQSALESMLKKTARGISTEIAKKTSMVLKNNIEQNLYVRQPGRVTGAYRSHFSGKPLIDAIYYENSVYDFDSYVSDVGFDIGMLAAEAEPPKLKGRRRYLGRYTDIKGIFVGDTIIGEMWLEEGVDKPPSLVRHPGAYYMEDTIQEIEDWISGGYIDSTIEKETGGIVIGVIK